MMDVTNRAPEKAPERASIPVVESETTRRLLRAAIGVFAEKGFESAGVAEIARRANLTTGAIYSRWVGKQEMLIDAVDHVMSHHLLHLIGGTSLSAPDMAAILGADLIVNDDHTGRAVLLEACVTARRDRTFAEMLTRCLADEESRLSAIICRGKADGFIDGALSTAALVTLCQALGFGMVVLRSVGRPVPSTGDWNELIERLITGVSPTAPTTGSAPTRPPGAIDNDHNIGNDHAITTRTGDR